MDPKQLPAIDNGEDNSSSGNGQPGKQQSSNEVDVNAEADQIVSEADKILSQQVPDLQGEEDEEDNSFVKVKKTDLEKQKEALKNYGTGLKSLKERASKLKPTKSEKKEETPVSQGAEQKKQPDRIIQVNQKAAIAKACENPEIEKNWGEIMKYFKYSRDPDLVENIVADIDDAFTLWQKHNSRSGQGGSGNRDAQRHLSTDNSRSSGGSGQGGGDGEKKSVLPKKVPISSWYSKSKTE